MIKHALILTALIGNAFAQNSALGFVIDESKPFAFLQLDHIGPRRPLGNEKENVGIWLRVVNNCRVPILVPTFGLTTGDPGVGVLDQVISDKPGMTITSVPAEIEPEPSSSATVDRASAYPKVGRGSGPADTGAPPIGYLETMSEVHSMTRIPPGHDLLFSVPTNHVGAGWFLRVGVLLDVSKPRIGESPYIELDFARWNIPASSPAEIAPKPHPPGTVLHKSDHVDLSK